MSVRRSASADVARLVAELSSAEAPRRDAAMARLRVIGVRAVSRLVMLADDAGASEDSRVAALQTLESVADARGTTVALGLVEAESDALAVAAAAVLGRALRGTGRTATRALDRLSAIALDAGVGVERRLAALAALDNLPPRQLRPIYEALARDPASRVVARVTRQQAGVMTPLDELIDAGLPDDPALVAAIVREDADSTRVTVLRRAVDAVRDKAKAGQAGRGPEWMEIRGQLHQALATKQSRLALYDLRDALAEGHATLPIGFLAAADAIGDTGCLEPLAKAWAAAGAAGSDRWWRDHLADVFSTIVTREGMTRRHPELVRILSRWPSAGVLVAAAPLRRAAKKPSTTSRTRP
jgi:hypothetical protein